MRTGVVSPLLPLLMDRDLDLMVPRLTSTERYTLRDTEVVNLAHSGGSFPCDI